MTPEQYCAEQAAPRGSTLYYSLLFLPVEQRCAITALHAFRRELSDALEAASDPGVARARLQWWREQLSAALQRQPPQHPVMKALAPVIERYGLAEERFKDIIDGAHMDLDYNRYPDFATLEVYCDRVSGALVALTAKVLGYTNPGADVFARALGLALELSRIIRDTGHDARRNRIYVPLDELQRFGLDSDDFVALREDERFDRLMAFQIDRARSCFERAEGLLSAMDRKSQRPQLIMAAIDRKLLDEIAQLRGRTLNQRVALTPLRKFWIAWRTWMSAGR